METPSGPLQIVVVPDGDLFLTVGGDLNKDGAKLTRFQVCRRAVRLASPVWRAMFDDEQSWTAAAECSMPEDDPEAMEVLLNIAHLRFNKASISSTHALIINIAVLCDKYDTVGLVRPWLLRWLEPLLPWDSNKISIKDRLFIYWTFGMMTDFKIAIDTVVCELSKHTDGRYFVDQDPLDGFANRLPSIVIEAIIRIQNETLKELAALFYSYTTRFTNPSLPCICRAPIGAAECSLLAYGSLMLGMREFQYPYAPLDDPSRTISKIEATIRGLEIKTMADLQHAEDIRQPGMSWVESNRPVFGANLFDSPLLVLWHTSCNFHPSMVVGLDAVMSKIGDKIQFTFVEHLQKQAEK